MLYGLVNFLIYVSICVKFLLFEKYFLLNSKYILVLVLFIVKNFLLERYKLLIKYVFVKVCFLGLFIFIVLIFK